MDRERTWLYEPHMGQLQEALAAGERGLRKHDFAGWHGLEEWGVRNRVEGLSRRHYRHTAEAAEELLKATGAELLVVGGHEETIAQFMPFLSHHLQSRVAGTFVIDPHTMTPSRVRERAEHVVASFEHDEETKLASQVLERVAAHGLAAAGLEGCLAAVNAVAVQLLLVDDDNEAPGRICRRCGWLGLVGDRCPVCDEPTRQTPDVIDEMVASVIDGGGQVEHVHEDAGLSKRLVAATLRFPVPDPRAGAGSIIPVSEEVSR